MAAGVSIKEASFADFQRDFCRVARTLLSDEQLLPSLRLDAEVTLPELDADFLSCHESLQPFGMGNAQPVFLARGVVPAAEPRVIKEKHLSFSLRHRAAKGGSYAPATRAIFFGGTQEPLPAAPWDVAFQIEANEYRGVTELQVQVQALRAAQPPKNGAKS